MTGIRIPPEILSGNLFQALQIRNSADGTTRPSLLFEAYPVGAFFDLATLLGFDHFLRHPVELLQDNGLATHPGHEGHDQWTLWAFIEGRSRFGVERTAAADAAEAHVGFDDADNFEPAERFANAIRRIRPNGAQTDHADFHAFLPHVVDGETSGDGVAALEEENDFGIFGFVFLEPRIVAAAEDARELFLNFLLNRRASLHGARTLHVQRRGPFRHHMREPAQRA